MILPIIGGLFLASLLLRKSPLEKASVPVATAPPTPGLDLVGAATTSVAIVQGGGALAGAAAATSSALAAGAVAITVAGAATGALITGTPEGALIGGINATAGNAGNLGAQGGRELHKLFGGDGQWGSLSGTTFQLAGFAGGVVAATFGLLAGITFIPVALLVGAVASAIEDANRLAYGQGGASRKFASDVSTQKDIAIEGFRKLFPDTSDEDLNRYAWAYAVGWVNKLNTLNWAQWSKKKPGIGVSYDAHMKYGLDRGYWYAPDGTTVFPMKATLPLDASEFWSLEEKTDLGRTAFANALNTGAKAANIYQYIWCMNQPRGTFVSDKDHAIYWASQGWFEGDIGSDGSLAYGGLRYDWRKKDTNFVAETVANAPEVEGFVSAPVAATGTIAATIDVTPIPTAAPNTPPPPPEYVAPTSSVVRRWSF